jgi:acetyl-CoA carboxylase beta subunit
MSWGSFITGAITALFMYALFTSDRIEEELEENDPVEDEIEINDFNTRHVTMSCQTCRKLKRHKEVKPNLFQCVKCKRHVDIRVS